jgi:Right handed beta helix region
MRRPTIAICVLLASAAALGVASPAQAAPAAPPAQVAARREPVTPPVDGARQAALVAAEDRRLINVRAVTAVAPLKGAAWTRPYRLDTGSGYTLVLTQASATYTIADLLTLAPQTFVRQKDGSYLLTENIYVSPGAKLKLTNPGGLTIRMASNSDGFVSIVSFGGDLTISGTAQAPTEIVSWDPRTDTTDTDTDDGRAYVRAIGGSVTMDYTTVRDLGFWSGRTGGLSLTGTDRPYTGNVQTTTHLTKDERHVATANRLASGPASVDDPPEAGGILAQPSGPLVTPDTRFDVPGLSYVSGNISHLTARGNAFGLFVSSATGINISDSTITDSLDDGLVMHRFATNAVINRVVSRHNGRAGFVLSRATQQVRIDGSTAEDNGGNGFTVSGRPLATGPSASGQSTASYGSNSVTSSVARNNGHYGIEILGGLDMGVQNNQIEGGNMGIVARDAAQGVTITGNQISGQDRQGIAIRDGVGGAKITGNVIRGGQTAIYVRDSVAEIRGNTVYDATDHGVSLVGAVDGSVVTFNTISGIGPSALDIARMSGHAEFTDNQTRAWFDTSSFWSRFRSYWSPMTILWTVILVVIASSGLIGRHRRRRRLSLGAHPYADKVTLSSTPVRELGPAPADHWEPVTGQIPAVVR